jgi:multimeric flavodoxin WrbA
MREKKIVALFGSPRKNANSTALADHIIAGAESGGAKTESFTISDMDIRPCTGCDACKEDASQNCIINDDMQSLYPKIKEADALIIASPVYWFSVSAQTKLVIDRCYALLGEKENKLKGKRIAIALTYADEDPVSSGAINAIRMFQDMFNFVGADIAGMVYGSALNPGEIEENKSLIEKAYKLGKHL